MSITVESDFSNTNEMPRFYDEPHFHVDIPVELTTVETFLVFNEEQQGYFPKRCVIDPLGLYLIVESEEGIPIDLTQASEVATHVVAECQSCYQLNWKQVTASSFCIYHGPELHPRCVHYFISKYEKTAERYVTWLKILINKPRLMNPSMDLLIHREYYRLLAFKTCIGSTPTKHLFESLRCGKNQHVFTKILKHLDIVDKKNRDVLNWKNLTPKLFKQFIYQASEMALNLVKLELMKDGSRGPIPFSYLQLFIDTHQTSQGMLSYREDPMNVYYHIETDDKHTKKLLVSTEAFNHYVFSEYFSAVNTSYATGFQDMTKPLSYYYINSSHNTYLTGRQVVAVSSVDMYKAVLLSGCRCVEIDCWDGPHMQPMVTHGLAMCSTIPLYNTLMAIKETAFTVSEYPVIISIENHLSVEQQKVMAEFLVDIFGDELLSEPVTGHPLNPGVLFPSPENLKRKIILKNKKLPEDQEKQLMAQTIKQRNTQKTSFGSTKTTVFDSVWIEIYKKLDDSLVLRGYDRVTGNEGEIENCVKKLSKESPLRLLDPGKKSSFDKTGARANRAKSLWSRLSFFKNNKKNCSTEYITEGNFQNDKRGAKKSHGSLTVISQKPKNSSFSSKQRFASTPKIIPKLHYLSSTCQPKQRASVFSKATSFNLPSLDKSAIGLPTELRKIDESVTLEQAQLGANIYRNVDDPLEDTLPPDDLHDGGSRCRLQPSREDSIEKKSLTPQFRAHSRIFEQESQNSGTATSGLTLSETENINNFAVEVSEIHPFLSVLVNYFKSVPFSNSFKKDEDNFYLTVASLNEGDCEKNIKENPVKFVQYTNRSLVRVFPRGNRLGSSNYNPQVMPQINFSFFGTPAFSFVR